MLNEAVTEGTQPNSLKGLGSHGVREGSPSAVPIQNSPSCYFIRSTQLHGKVIIQSAELIKTGGEAPISSMRETLSLAIQITT